MTKTWDNIGDWASPQEIRMVHSGSPLGTDWSDAGTLEIGYPRFDQRASALEAYYPLAEGSGDTMYDVYNDQDGTYDADVAFAQSGILGRNAIGFSPTNGTYGESPADVTANSSTFSTLLWYYYPSSPSDDDFAPIVMADADNGSVGDNLSDGWMLRFDGTTDAVELVFADAGATTSSGTITLTTDAWHCLIVRGNGSDGWLDVYFTDGTTSSQTLTGSRTTGTATLRVGGGDSNLHVNGRACNLRAWSRELDDSDLDELALEATPTGYIITEVK